MTACLVHAVDSLPKHDPESLVTIQDITHGGKISLNGGIPDLAYFDVIVICASFIKQFSKNEVQKRFEGLRLISLSPPGKKLDNVKHLENVVQLSEYLQTSLPKAS